MYDLIENNEEIKTLHTKVKRSKKQSKGEEIGNSITHGIGATFIIVAVILMYIKCDSALDYISITIFGLSGLALYLSSSLYHAFKKDTKVKKLFRIFDHTTIFILIAGSYAPILLVQIGGTLGYVCFAIQWAMVLLLILLRIFKPKKSTLIQTILCVALGWVGIIFVKQIWDSSIPMFLFILAEGITYTLGISFYASRFKYAHFVWHLFVILGTVFHFVAVYIYVL
ncbi:MAG: PAQR family membrane homeostasis protein TrhA [Anaeroplasmataceae bacterium]